MYTERMAIQDEFHANRQSIRELRDRNMDLLKRLRDIDERDMKSSSMDAMEHMTTKLTEIVGKISNLLPEVPLETMLDHIAKTYDFSQAELPTVEKEPEPTPVEIAANEHKILHTSYPERASKERTASIIVDIIAEKKVVKTSVIEEEFYKRTGRKFANFNEQIRQAMMKFPRIERLGRGKCTLKKDDLPNINNDNNINANNEVLLAN